MKFSLTLTRVALPVLLQFALWGAWQNLHAATPGTPYGKVVLLTGTVNAIDPVSGKTRKLKVGDVVYVNERTVATAASEAVIKTQDSGVIAVRPGAAFAVERFTNKGGEEDRFSINIFEGALRLISGLIGKRNPESVKVSTEASTVGIRGTDFEPFVLSKAQSEQFAQPAGTYNRVYRGATYLESNNGKVDVAAGQTGFAPQPSSLTPKGLLTLLMPVILEKVPAFFVPGRYDAQLDRFVDPSARSPAPVVKTKETSPAKETAKPAEARPAIEWKDIDPCKPADVAQAWLAEFDRLMAQKDAQRVLDLFDAQAKISVVVRTSNGLQRTLDMGREDMVRSTIESLQRVTEYKIARNALEATALETGCRSVQVESVAIESGLRNGSPYRFESVESFKLELQNGKWQAVSAAAKQR